jgi:hypothetical protein
VGAGCKAFDGGWVGSATKAQILKVTAYAWVEVVTAAAPKGRTFVVVERLRRCRRFERLVRVIRRR